MKHVKTQLSAFIDGELPEDELRDIKVHIAECTECATELKELKAVTRQLKELPRAPLPSGFSYRLNIKRHKSASDHIFIAPAWRPAAFAMTGLLVAMIGYQGLRGPGSLLKIQEGLAGSSDIVDGGMRVTRGTDGQSGNSQDFYTKLAARGKSPSVRTADREPVALSEENEKALGLARKSTLTQKRTASSMPNPALVHRPVPKTPLATGTSAPATGVASESLVSLNEVGKPTSLGDKAGELKMPKAAAEYAGVPYGAKNTDSPNYTNEELHAMLEAEKKASGMTILPKGDKRKGPTAYQTLIRNRRAIMTAAGRRAPIAVGGASPQILAASKKVSFAPGAPVAPTTGAFDSWPNPGEPVPAGLMVRSQAQMKNLLRTVRLKSPPSVNFKKQMLVVIIEGIADGREPEILSAKEEKGKFVVRYRIAPPPTKSSWSPGAEAEACSVEPSAFCPEGETSSSAKGRFRVVTKSTLPILFKKTQ